jgi:hypothetical protein
MNKEEKMNFLAESLKKARQVIKKVDENESKGVIPNTNRISYAEEAYEREPIYEQPQVPKSTMKNLSNSKMPKEILESFINTPVIDPTLPLDLEQVVEKASKQIPKNQQKPTRVNEGGLIDKDLIEFIIKKTVEETVSQMQKTQTINENIQIRVGDKVFSGKLVSLKEIKKTK